MTTHHDYCQNKLPLKIDRLNSALCLGSISSVPILLTDYQSTETELTWISKCLSDNANKSKNYISKSIASIPDGYSEAPKLENISLLIWMPLLEMFLSPLLVQSLFLHHVFVKGRNCVINTFKLLNRTSDLKSEKDSRCGRLLTVQRADLICICIKDEKVVEQGKHFELLNDDEIHGPLCVTDGTHSQTHQRCLCINCLKFAIADASYDSLLKNLTHLCPLREEHRRAILIARFWSAWQEDHFFRLYCRPSGELKPLPQTLSSTVKRLRRLRATLSGSLAWLSFVWSGNIFHLQVE
ncbi:hypothetical protein PROFUN_14263 [Planoprotostelium fungivorum]|uniref:Uncharacterized protein n=1 Tax=Planoprotostelium fungivorum TaxID=1890364 RepID=A0A2P6N0P1_9EUKA|nr:hypothetical protein PROFUN_14263 [Planoprotostelium fungivorum]